MNGAAEVAKGRVEEAAGALANNMEFAHYLADLGDWRGAARRYRREKER